MQYTVKLKHLITLTIGIILSFVSYAEVALPKDLQSMKGELVNLNRDISQLENELLFPNTETAIVLGIEAGSGITVNEVQVIIDDNPGIYYSYRDVEQAALVKSGLHRVYTGNLTSGSHTIKAIISGKDSSGKEFKETTGTFSFTKGTTRKIIQIQAANNSTRTQSEIRFRELEVQ